tara:strand:+ start:78 stop:665 length:588 start_codon:yes stop_codon:yes gene_type:complete
LLFFNTSLNELRILDISLFKNNYFMKQLSKTTLVYILTFFITGFLFADKVEPPKDSVPFRGSHYKAFLDTNSTWWEAKFACDDIGGELVVISSAPENEFVRRMAKDNLVWLGGTDEFEEGKWTWDNGEPFKFKHWDEKQPAGTNGFNFLILNGKNGKWADTTDFSGKVKGYICEWKGSAPKNAGPKDSDLKPPAK